MLCPRACDLRQELQGVSKIGKYQLGVFLMVQGSELRQQFPRCQIPALLFYSEA